jgi:photosystem II stability/assembly factor-like uncharacterized protein
MGDGIYKSTDGGQNWNMGLPKSDRIFYYRWSKNSDIVWVGVLGALWGSDERVFIKQQTGNHLEQSFVDNKTGCSDLIIDQNSAICMPLLGI